MLQNLIFHNKYSSGRWSSGDASGVMTTLPGLLGGYWKGFFPLHLVFFVLCLVIGSWLVTTSN